MEGLGGIATKRTTREEAKARKQQKSGNTVHGRDRSEGTTEHDGEMKVEFNQGSQKERLGWYGVKINGIEKVTGVKRARTR